jgi:hypothetical protein
MPRFAAALLCYWRSSDDAYYLAVGRSGSTIGAAPRIEELIWSPHDTFAGPRLAKAALERFAPRRGNTVLQNYVVRVKPFLLDDEAFTVRQIVSWSTPALEWLARDEAA